MVQTVNRQTEFNQRSARGFSMVELMITVLIMMVMLSMTIPATRSTIANYQLSAAVDSATGAIQATRYQAIMHGYPYKIAFDSVTKTYQVSAQVPPAVTYTNVGTPVPLSGAAIALSASTTLLCSRNGSVSASVGAMNFNITYGSKVKTLTVSNYGSISVQ